MIVPPIHHLAGEVDASRARHSPPLSLSTLSIGEGLATLHAKGKLRLFGELDPLHDAGAFARHLAPFRRSEWVVYAKAPFGGPEAALAYLSRYTSPLPGRRLLACRLAGAFCVSLVPNAADR